MFLVSLDGKEVGPLDATLEQIDDFDEIIDVRTPLEYEEDHVPGSINAPVLSNEERARVGTLYVKVSPFEATRLGGALVAHNLSVHLQDLFHDRPADWRPLVYCWRGGKRSASMAGWLRLMGWDASQLRGGYRTYRHWVLDRLEQLPLQLRCIVLLGPTGTGKTRLLHALRNAGAQVLDLEGLARHRGSLLGGLPHCEQPTQKGFQSALVEALGRLDFSRPVFVEAESARIGRVSLPASLLKAMHGGRCVIVEAPEHERLDFLLQDYEHLFRQRDDLKSQLSRLTALHGKKTIAHWHALVDTDARCELFTELIRRHYDPAYARSSHGHYRLLAASLRFAYHPNDPDQDGQARGLLYLLSTH